ncbi:hypothetical protein M0804_007361 [Polistes exclamans]|nr:hypothetical protein M0804_007361 [Polistes exclamans]
MLRAGNSEVAIIAVVSPLQSQHLIPNLRNGVPHTYSYHIPVCLSYMVIGQHTINIDSILENTLIRSSANSFSIK